MKFSQLSIYLDQLDSTSSRIEITKILSTLLKSAQDNEIDKIIYLVLGRLAPQYHGLVFNIADQLMLQSLSLCYATDLGEVKKLYRSLGDLGLVAEKLKKEKTPQHHPKPLSVIDVFNRLKTIALDEGEGSQDRKITEMARLLSELDGLSVRFVTRIPIGKLRLGFSDKTIIDALSWQQNADKQFSQAIKKAYDVLPDIGLLARLIKQSGIENATKNIKPIIGTPVMPMLAQRLKSPAEMIKKMGEVAIEPKFDGLRLQIHFQKNKPTKAFTRNLNETSWMFPELESIGQKIKANSAIFDCEAVGLSENSKKMVNFQTTMTRRRKHEVLSHSQKTPIRFQVFDLLFLNDKSLLHLSYEERRKLLKEIVTDKNLLIVDEYLVTSSPEVITQKHKEWIKKGLEGIIVKQVNSEYVPGRTGWRWVKMKEEEQSKAKLKDTVDCIIMGYSFGKGKRSGFGMGQFLAGIKDQETVKTITKVGTGLTDEQFRTLKKRLKKLETSQKPKEYIPGIKSLLPDFWVIPNLVVELAADEITKSPGHSSGFALRFPRLVRFRDDKSPSDATTLSEIKKLFQLQ
ncbi:hypothetical protein A2382_02770 [Candidatus Woesebacteria bacterium RIFOXYB1_FULL_38_16]|uniref:DNA ligase (ATP) n=1 Tax=Candidatus Woesebacteria bacterium RIFOXYB1_FULL_38_16 TaxID=1802538 RepID=A0A1F8CS48_9BACT|nr:MAG: hypothetical protein A2382_02770 [Candidatus Woesebacteria bacterium RIFOXYB1_FULL_38_16]